MVEPHNSQFPIRLSDADLQHLDSWQGTTIVAPAEDEVVGKTLNDTYIVERIVGEGAMGRIYQARHTRIAQKRVAVKVLRREYLRNQEVLARFRREAETAASISHPNVVAVYDIDRTEQGLPYLVTEYLDGIDLGEHLRRQKKLGVPSAVHIARQLCEGLGAAHRCGVIHRDLKPGNIFLVSAVGDPVPELPFIKILDFGLSKFMDASVAQLVTAIGVVMGTPAFMPPEQAQAQPVDQRADVYGVGALLYVCLTGCLPFDEITPQATVVAVIKSEPPRPRTLAPDLPEYAEQVIVRAMAKEPSERYPDMGALLEALEPLAQSQRVHHDVRPPPSPPPSSNTPARRPHARRPLIKGVMGSPRTLAVALASLVTLALLTAAVAVGFRRHAPRDLALASTHAAPTASSGPATVEPAPPPRALPEVMPEQAAPLVAASPPARLASDEELRAARGSGEKVWQALADRYPDDPRVLRALVMAYASHAGGLGDAMNAAHRLFRVAPEQAERRDMQYLVGRAAETRGEPAARAWKLMVEDMGPSGPDVLYRLIVTKPRLAERARQLLDSAPVRRRVTPALAIAYELKSAPSCAARLPLLDRAIEEGDGRALSVLAGLSTGTQRGCGRNKRKPCSPACPAQVAQFRGAVARLSQRLRTTRAPDPE
ncbi:MAG: protein kinase [Polyangiaceae bacterium]|nr:protein kinase [Polyangiaceae bacterium]